MPAVFVIVRETFAVLEKESVPTVTPPTTF